jgi:hypothetical protein
VADLLDSGVHDGLELGRGLIPVVLASVVARFAFSARSVSSMAWRLAAGALLLGAAEIAFHLAHRNPHPPPATLAASILTGTLLVGLVVAAYSWALGWLVGKHANAKSCENADRAVIAAATWVLVGQLPSVPMVLGGFALRSGHPALEQAWDRMPWGRTALLFGGLNVVPPALLALGALRRIRARRAWLATVRVGALPHWRLVEGLSEVEGLPHLVGAGGGEARTLVHAAEQPFREGESLEPIAVVSAATTPR